MNFTYPLPSFSSHLHPSHQGGVVGLPLCPYAGEHEWSLAMAIRRYQPITRYRKSRRLIDKYPRGNFCCSHKIESSQLPIRYCVFLHLNVVWMIVLLALVSWTKVNQPFTLKMTDPQPSSLKISAYYCEPWPGVLCPLELVPVMRRIASYAPGSLLFWNEG